MLGMTVRTLGSQIIPILVVVSRSHKLNLCMFAVDQESKNLSDLLSSSTVMKAACKMLNMINHDVLILRCCVPSHHTVILLHYAIPQYWSAIETNWLKHSMTVYYYYRTKSIEFDLHHCHNRLQ